MKEEKELDPKEVSDIKERLADIVSKQKVLNTMLDKGLTFTMKHTERVRAKGIRGFFGKKEIVETEETYTIKEPTLAVLDMMSAEWLKFDLTELEGIMDDSALEASYKIVTRHAKDLARVIAIASLGERYYSVEGGDEKELQRLADLFYRYATPSQMRDLAMFITASGNIADFIVSMRLMRSAVTVTPTERIE
jgi:hypothetical protein